MSEEDFWNQSFTNSSNFFDEDDDDTSATEEEILHSLQQKSATLPIHSIISHTCLNLILDSITSTIKYSVTPPKDAVRMMFIGHNIALSSYKTFESKMQLLDESVELGDGKIIIAVTIYAKKTLKRNLFFAEIAKRKVVYKHYVNYVIEANDLTELADLYMCTGNIAKIKEIYYLINRNTVNSWTLHMKLKQFLGEHSRTVSPDDLSEMEKIFHFYEWQIVKNKPIKSLVMQLFELCKLKWSTGWCTSDEILAFRTKFLMDEFQYEWITLNVLCQLRNWSTLVVVFIKSAWVLKKRALKSTIRVDLFVNTVGKYQPPKETMEQFLACIGDSSKSVAIAEKMKFHSYVINYYIEQKDRVFLIHYMDRLETGNAAREQIQGALNSSVIKWKN